ncbi:hypothetical protein Tco_1031144 [Tanacetum coccineum]|uniref:Reverse transcriptase domain-containing protein n=1 Tax=Tanacetum coccineum TaxID=301880 RepID=A0ABQ5G9W7_9ASTR
MDNRTPKRKSMEESIDEVGEITFPPVLNINSSDLVSIKARIVGRQVSSDRIKDSARQLLSGTLLASRRRTFGNYNRSAMQRMGQRGAEKAKGNLSKDSKGYPQLRGREREDRFQRKVSGANNRYRKTTTNQLQDETTRSPKSQRRCLRMELSSHDGNPENPYGCNLEVRIDDMVIKRNSKEYMLIDIKETFEKLRAINMKLNLSKCSFSVEEGSFLGHLITKQGIKANPSKVKAILDLQPPKMIKEIQKLHKGEDSLMDDRGRRSFLKHERVHRNIANSHNPNRMRNLDNVPRSIRRKHNRGVVNRERKKVGTDTGPSAEDRETEFKETKSKEPRPENSWKLFTDGASSSDGSRAGLMLVIPEGKE